MKKAIVAGLVAAVLAAGASAQDTVKISGIVKTPDGKGVAGVTVVLNYYQQWLSGLIEFAPQGEMKAATGADGRFTLTVPSAATSLRMTIEPPVGTRSWLTSYDSEPDVFGIGWEPLTSSQVTLTMQSGAGVVTGKVTGPGGKPVAGAAIVVQRKLSHPRTNNDVVNEEMRITTGADGTYRMDGLPPGDYHVESLTPPRGSGLVPLTGWRGVGSFSIIRSQPTTHDFRGLEAGASIRGRVVDEAGKPIAGAKVFAGLAPATIEGPQYYQKVGNHGDETTTDAAGKYALEGLSPETYEVSATSPEGAALAPSGHLTGIRVDAEKTVSAQDIVMVPGGTLKGKVAGADGKPVAGATVVYGHAFATTAADGTYRFGPLATGAAALKIAPPAGSVWAAKTVEGVASVAKVNVLRDVALEKGGAVSGVVRGADGKIVPGARVSAYLSIGNQRYHSTSDRDGKFLLVGLVENKGTDYQGKPVVYSLVAEPPAESPYMSGSLQFGIKLGEQAVEDLDLAMGASVKVTVTTADGKPVKGSSISVFTEQGRGSRSYYAGGMMGAGPQHLTGADGTAVIRQIQPGPKSIDADPPEGANLLYGEKRDVKFVAGETAEAAVVLREGGVIHGVVLDEKGQPMADASVRIQTGGRVDMGWGRMAKPVTTDEKGKFEITALPTGDFSIETVFFDQKHIAPPQTVKVARGETTDAKVQAFLGGFIDLTVTGADGKAFTSVGVQAKGTTSAGPSGGYAYANKDGVATMGPIIPGTYSLTVSPYVHGGIKPAVVEIKDIVVAPGQRVRRDVKLEDVSMPPPEPPKQLKPGDEGPEGGGKEVFKGAKEEVFVK